ncbi:MAG: NAD(P)/FAD-dependent oxidoreductase [Bacteroidetes bacterium]|nr:NAD(P)/FAD-dependent oxidoreductase [Bacteroidota bacterium]
MQNIRNQFPFIYNMFFKKLLPLFAVIILFAFKNKKATQMPNLGVKSVDTCCFDLIIIGGGSSAFSAAKTASKMNKKILLINAGLRIGGTCINVGCMPSKYLVRAAESIYKAKNIKYKGITPGKPHVHFKKFIRGKKEYVNEIWQSKYPSIIKNMRGLTYISGWAKFKGKNVIEVNGREYTAKKYIIATGAKTKIPDIKSIEDIDYLTHRTLFDLEDKPKSITIIGAGYIGLEIACLYSQLGVKVRVVNRADRILHKQTRDLGNELEKHLTNLGIEFHHNCNIEKVEKKGSRIMMYGKRQADKPFELIERGQIVLATGVLANTKVLDIESIKLKLDKKGSIIVNNKMETSIPNIYAIGDCVNTPMYVYTAYEEGRIAALNAFRKKKVTVNYKALPWVMFTNPKFAGAGIDEMTAKTKKIPYQVSVIQMSWLARSSTSLDKRGIIKLIRNPKTDKLIGGRVIGANAGEIAMQISMAIKYGIKVSELKRIFYPYLTSSEAIGIAAQNFK